MKKAVVRKPAVAGMFYPDDPAELRQMIVGYLHAAKGGGPVPKAIIAPHAGYVYSGPIAGTAYARISRARGVIRRVVLLGPSHRVPFRGMAVSRAEVFATPLGNVPVDSDAVKLIQDLPHVQVLDQAHAGEHSLEVQLPFLQEVLGADFSLVPITVGEATPEQVADVLDRLWGGPETLIVISSDLSHYMDYRTASRLDRATSDAIEALNPAAIGYEQACGRIPVCGMLLAAKRHGLKAHTIDLRNSGDTAGSREEVVGYGAYVSKPPEHRLPDEDRRRLLKLALDSITHGVDAGQPLPVRLDDLPESLRVKRATFVTLEIGGNLRGCIGMLEAQRPLAEDVAENAYAAAFEDPRFPPVTNREVAKLDLHISVLSPPEPISFTSEEDLLRQIRPGIDGLILSEGRRRGTFLPSVWDDLPDPWDFLRHLKMKAGLPKDYWSDTVRVDRYTTEYFP